jgi:hypothetical protein
MRRLLAAGAALALLLAVTPGAVAREHGTDRPIWSNLGGEVNFYVQPDPDCPILTVSDGHGTMSHLGRVHVHWTHCPPVALPQYTNHHVTITAADGDTLVGTYDINGDAPYRMVITGGTDRFAGATGHLTFDFRVQGEWANGLPVNPWQAWWQLEGTISY